MKKILYNTVFCFCLFFVAITSVKAASLNKKDITVECTYSDGSVIISAPINGNISVSRETAQIVTDDDAESNEIAEYVILNKDTVLSSSNTCNAYLIAAQKSVRITEECIPNADPDEKPDCEKVDPYTVTTAYYKTSSSSNNNQITNAEVGKAKHWYDFFTSKEEYANSSVKNAKAYKLVSERIYIENESILDELTDKQKCYYVKKAEQAAGTNSYLNIYIFDNVTLASNNGMITTLVNSTGVMQKWKTCNTKTLYFNDPTSKIDVSKSSPKYRYDFPRLGYKTSKSNDYNSKFEYTTTPPPGGDDIGKNACASIPETLKVLKTIISILQIGVPAFVIILTSIDIFRMVVAGNLDEELPKRKKSIIIRLIIMLVFFFLPLFINVGLNLIYTNSDWFRKEVGIKDIKCLFE